MSLINVTNQEHTLLQPNQYKHTEAINDIFLLRENDNQRSTLVSDDFNHEELTVSDIVEQTPSIKPTHRSWQNCKKKWPCYKQTHQIQNRNLIMGRIMPVLGVCE